MDTILINCKIFIIVLSFAIGCNCQLESPGVSSSWAKLEISPDTLSSMEYGNFLIEIYEHANNHKAITTASQKKYFYSPLALLDHKSAVSIYNRVTKKPEMRFRVEMWNDKVQNEVVKHLNEIVGQDIKYNQVRVIPLEKVILTSKGLTPYYSLSPEWTNYDKSKTLQLSLTCFDQKVCDEMANEMRSHPEQFDHLKLLYSLSSQTSQTKQTTISIDSITSGQMVSNLLQKFGDKKDIFLTANDEKKMLAETATNIRMDTFDDSEVGSLDTEFQIYNILKELLVTSRETIKEQSDKMWDSVFWNDDNYRPDKTTKTLNEIINKLDTETQKKLADMFEKAERQSEIIEKLNSNNQEVEKKREEQFRRENQTKDTNENENRKSQATELEQFSRNETRDEKSKTNKVDSLGFNLGIIPQFSIGLDFGSENNDTHSSQQEIKEKRENEKKTSDEHNRNLEKKEKIQHNYDANSWANVDRISSTISGKLTNDSDSSRKVESLKEDVEKLLQESKNHVQWDGEKFIPKPMQLSRINLGKFRDSQSFQNRNVRVRYTNAELSAPIKFMEHAQLTVTDEWNNLKDELKANAELLNTTVKYLVKTSGELSRAKLDLSNTRIDLAEAVMMLGKMNNEMINAKKDLTLTKNNLEGTKQELEKTKIELGKTRSDFSKIVEDLSKKIKGTENELTIRTGNLSIELKTNLVRLGHECKVKEENLRKEQRATSISLETTNANLKVTRTELINAKSTLESTVEDLKRKLNDRTSEIVDISQMPTSCADLARMGHKLSGFFSVKGSKKMEMVYCNFHPNQKEKQKWIGYVGVKSAPVYFDVHRSSSFSSHRIPIPWDVAVVNEGNAMNLTTGKFTAPRTGIYFFFFTGLAKFPDTKSLLFFGAFSTVDLLIVSLYLNGVNIRKGYPGDEEYRKSSLTLQSTLKLKKGDRVWLQIYDISRGVTLGDYNDHTHFTGFMLKEEIVVDHIDL